MGFQHYILKKKYECMVKFRFLNYYHMNITRKIKKQKKLDTYYN